MGVSEGKLRGPARFIPLINGQDVFKGMCPFLEFDSSQLYKQYLTTHSYSYLQYHDRGRVKREVSYYLRVLKIEDIWVAIFLKFVFV